MNVRIVALADTHLFPLDEVVSGSGLTEDDVLVHAGDLCRRGTLAELEVAARELASLPPRTKIVVAGNHEVCLQKQPAEARAVLRDHGLVYLEDDGVEVRGLRFHGSPWQPIFRVWAFGARRGAELAAKWASIPEGTDVLVTHGPPAGFGDRVRIGRLGARRFGGSPDREVTVGCVDLRRRVEEVQPLLHLFGHIHQGRGAWRHGPSVLVNATTAEGELPAAVVEVDVARRAVVSLSLAPGDQNSTFGTAVDSALAWK